MGRELVEVERTEFGAEVVVGSVAVEVVVGSANEVVVGSAAVEEVVAIAVVEVLAEELGSLVCGVVSFVWFIVVEEVVSSPIRAAMVALTFCRSASRVRGRSVARGGW